MSGRTQRADCSVRAASTLLEITYDEADTLLAQFGRKRNCRLTTTKLLKAIRSQEFTVTKIPILKRFTVRTAPGLLPSHYRYLLVTSGHFVALFHGRIEDWTQGRLHRVIEVYGIERTEF